MPFSIRLGRRCKKLKKVKYILMSYKSTLIEKDQAAVSYNKDLNEQPDTL